MVLGRGGGVDVDAPAVGLDDGQCDRHAQARGAGAPFARGVPPGEALEEAVARVGGDPRAVVVDAHDERVPLAGQRCGHVATGWRVDPGVGQEVDDDLAQAGLVADDQRRLGQEVLSLLRRGVGRRLQDGQIQLPVVVGAGCAGVGHRVHQETDQVHLLAAQLAPGVQAGQQQQVLDERRHPHRLGVHALQGIGGLLRQVGVGPLAADELGVAADRGQRRAQLVGGVGHELAHLRLRALARGQGGLHVPQQRVEGAADLPDLGRGVQVRLLHAVLDAHLAALQRLGGHALRGAGHPLQGCQRGAHHGPPGQGHHEGAQQGHRQLDEQLGADEPLVALQGEPGDDRAARGLIAGGHHPVAAQVVQVHGDGVVLRGLGQQQPAVLLGDGRVVAVLVDVGGGLTGPTVGG